MFDRVLNTLLYCMEYTGKFSERRVVDHEKEISFGKTGFC